MAAFFRQYITRRVVIIAILVWVGLCLLIAGSIFLTIPDKNQGQSPTALLTVIHQPEATATSLPDLQQPDETTGIHIGGYVKITGTEGDGLRIRSGPGTANTQKFYGHEGEIFEVKDGPVESDGYTWWYIIATNDNTRVGWAAGDYLLETDKP